MAKKVYDKPRNYISGSAREKRFSEDFGIINIDMKLSDLEKIVTDTGYVKICVANVKGGEDRFGNTHSIYENDFVPDKTRTPKKSTKVNEPKDIDGDGDDLPF